MTTAVVALRIMLAGYFGKRWQDAAAENLALKTQVAWLKRLLARSPGS
jgi:hypothetical protein